VAVAAQQQAYRESQQQQAESNNMKNHHGSSMIPQSPVVSTNTPKSPPNSSHRKAAPLSGTSAASTPSSTGSPPSSPKEHSSSPPSSTMRRMGKDLPQHRQIDNMIVDENNERQWYTGCLPLGLADDKYWLSELQVYLRANFAEGFGATEDDIAAPMHGRNKPIALGQVGIRCMHCKCTCNIFLLVVVIARKGDHSDLLVN
jgi:hypothetical protein